MLVTVPLPGSEIELLLSGSLSKDKLLSELSKLLYSMKWIH